MKHYFEQQEQELLEQVVWPPQSLISTSRSQSEITWRERRNWVISEILGNIRLPSPLKNCVQANVGNLLFQGDGWMHQISIFLRYSLFAARFVLSYLMNKTKSQPLFLKAIFTFSSKHICTVFNVSQKCSSTERKCSKEKSWVTGFLG